MKLLGNHGNCAGVVTDGQVITRSYSLRYHGDLVLSEDVNVVRFFTFLLKFILRL